MGFRSPCVVCLMAVGARSVTSTMWRPLLQRRARHNICAFPESTAVYLAESDGVGACARGDGQWCGQRQPSVLSAAPNTDRSKALASAQGSGVGAAQSSGVYAAQSSDDDAAQSSADAGFR